MTVPVASRKKKPAKKGGGKKVASATRKRSATPKKAADATRKRALAAKKAAATRKRNAAAKARAAKLTAKRRSLAAKKGWATRRHAMAVDAGRSEAVEAVLVAVYSTPETGDTWDSESVVARVSDAVLDALNKGRRPLATGEVIFSVNPFGKAWRTEIPLNPGVTLGALVRPMAGVDRAVDLEGARVWFGLITAEGGPEPLAGAFETMGETVYFATEALAESLVSYRGVDFTPRSEREDDPEPEGEEVDGA